MKNRSNINIVKRFNKYGVENFSILILEIIENKENILNLEQYYISTYFPEYNILMNAGDSLGCYTHTAESKIKISLRKKNKIWSEEDRIKKSKIQIGSNKTFYGKSHTQEVKNLISWHALNRIKDPKQGFNVEVVDTLTNNSTFYKSLQRAGKRLNTSHGNLSKYRANSKLYMNQYKIIIDKNTK